MGRGEVALLSSAVQSLDVSSNNIASFSDGLFDGVSGFLRFVSFFGLASVCLLTNATNAQGHLYQLLDCYCAINYTNDEQWRTYCGSWHVFEFVCSFSFFFHSAIRPVRQLQQRVGKTPHHIGEKHTVTATCVFFSTWIAI
jgi:hypothetical protein